MAITIQTRAEIEAATQAFFRTQFPDWGLGPTDFLGKLSRVFSLTVYGLLRAVRAADADWPPSASSGTAALDAAAFSFGVSDGAGGYGRKQASPASGGAATSISGVGGTTFSSGATLTASDGVTKVALSGAVTIPGTAPATSTASGVFVAVTKGTAGNLPVGSVLTWDSPPTGADPTATLTTALSGGADLETDGQLLSRILYRLQNPPKACTAPDYRQWAESREGVYRAFVYPRRGGTGTVDVVLTASGKGTERVPSSAVQADVQSYLDEVRIVSCDSVRVLLPTTGSGLNIRVRVVPTTANAFDFSGSTTAAAQGAGEPLTKLRVAALPTGLAVGDRVQVAATSSGSPTLAAQRTVTAVDTTTASPTVILTLDSALAVYPAVGDAVYSGGPVVEAIQTAVWAEVYGLGPSRASGYADAFDDWRSTLYLDQLRRAALDATDDSGARLILSTVAVTIDGAAADRAASDGLTTAPELLWAKVVSVTP